MSNASQSDREYTEQLGVVLARRDPEALRAFLTASARRFGDESQEAQITQQSADALEMLMHRMILSRPDLAAHHAESQAWLEQRGQAVGQQVKARPARGPRQPNRPGKRS